MKRLLDNYLFVFILMSLLIITLWITSAIIMINIENRGEFGDMFGAVNSLFSGLAFAAFIVTLLMQKKELEDNRIELKKSAEAHTKSTTLSALTTLLSEYDQQINILTEDLRSVYHDQEENEGYIKSTRKSRRTYMDKKEFAIKAIESILEEQGLEINSK